MLNSTLFPKSDLRTPTRQLLKWDQALIRGISPMYTAFRSANGRNGQVDKEAGITSIYLCIHTLQAFCPLYFTQFYSEHNFKNFTKIIDSSSWLNLLSAYTGLSHYCWRWGNPGQLLLGVAHGPQRTMIH